MTIDKVREETQRRMDATDFAVTKGIFALTLALLDEHEKTGSDWHMPTCDCVWCKARLAVEKLLEAL